MTNQNDFKLEDFKSFCDTSLNLLCSMAPSLPKVKPLGDVIDVLKKHLFSISNGTSNGRNFAREIKSLLSVELQDDLVDLVELQPGWADETGKGVENLTNNTFVVMSTLLLCFILVDLEPDALVADPRQTINFKFGAVTVIVDGSNKLTFFNRNTYEQSNVTLLDLIPKFEILRKAKEHVVQAPGDYFPFSKEKVEAEIKETVHPFDIVRQEIANSIIFILLMMIAKTH